MRALAAAIGAFSVALLVSGQLPIYVAISGIVLAVIVYQARTISAYLRIFVTMYALGYVLLVAASILGAFGLVPDAVAALMPPPFGASAAVAFAAIVYGASFLPAIRTITAIADPYFATSDSSKSFAWPFAWLGRSESQVGARLVALLVVINFFQVAMQIRLNVWYRDLFNALQSKDSAAFWYQILGVFAPLAAIWISVAVYEIFVDNSLKIRWRAWLTRSISGRWLANGTHYHIALAGLDTDNPDQRIQADIRAFLETTMSLSISLLSQAATLVSFIIILWGLSRDFVIPGTDNLVISGFLVWLVIGYAVVGTWLTHLIGRPLIALDFNQERVEADFRFSLARLREYSEQIALLKGERAEASRLDGSFSQIIANYLRILSRRMKLTTFTAGYSQLSVIFPYVLAAPSYFLGKITLGQFQQTASAFNQVQSALSFFITAYQTLASYKATVDRLTTFNASMSRAESGEHGPTIAAGRPKERDLAIETLRVSLPDGRVVVNMDDFTFRSGESTLVTGPSGSGKSTMFRALSGVWPFGEGRIRVPAGESMMLLPQKPYIPSGSLKAAVTYPALPEEYGDEAVGEALRAVHLEGIADHLDELDSWGHRLSGGEQQRLSFARALLARPDWLLLDESTASLDEPLEAQIYALVLERLPNTTIVSIGHRSTLTALHRRNVAMHRSPAGTFDLRDRLPAPAVAPAAE